jgi:hypothetical protein
MPTVASTRAAFRAGLQRAGVEDRRGWLDLAALTYTCAGSWVSAGGPVYRRASADYENRLRHILRHATPNPGDLKFTAFVGDAGGVPALIDQAWTRQTAQARITS